MARPETHIDDEALSTGTHKGGDGGLIIRDKDRHFRSLGVLVGLAVYNDTDESNGLVTAVTEEEVTCTLLEGTSNTWTNGDTYSIYKTSAKNTPISTIYTDKSKGWKVTDPSELDDGWFHDDVDLDGDEFGPGQPEN